MRVYNSNRNRTEAKIKEGKNQTKYLGYVALFPRRFPSILHPPLRILSSPALDRSYRYWYCQSVSPTVAVESKHNDSAQCSEVPLGPNWSPFLFFFPSSAPHRAPLRSIPRGKPHIGIKTGGWKQKKWYPLCTVPGVSF